MKRKAVIFGIKSTYLNDDEKYLFKNEKPWGIILFSRNIKDIFQLKLLIRDIKNIFKDKKYPIMIDQEGGRISRLNKIIDFSIFSQEFFGKLYKKDKKKLISRYEIYINKVCDILNGAGININTVPVLDVKRPKGHKIIGDRSFSEDPNIVSEMGKLCIRLHQRRKVATVIKHIPGHGLAKCDSHYDLPVIKSKKDELIKIDFNPFKSCRSLFAMTAHAVFSKYDPIYTATHSKIIINDVIRKHIGFKGILISDDISMKALDYGMKDNVIRALDSGCNLVLHCNGNIKEMKKLVKIIPTIDRFTQKKTSHFYKFLG